MNLEDIRKQLDVIDAQMVELYEKRMALCADVAAYKIENGKQVLDRTRESEKLAKVRELAHNELNKQCVEELFEHIMSMSRKLQYRMLAESGNMIKLPFIGHDILPIDNAKVVYQGSEGADSQ